MKVLLRTILFCLLGSTTFAQNVYQIRADSVRIYSGCDTAELIIENHTKDTLGFLFNKGQGRTEFRKLHMKMLGDNSLAIVGQDTVQLGNYIQNQAVLNQVATFAISGSAYSQAQFQVKRNGSDAVSGGFALYNALQTRGTIMQLNGATNPGLATWIHSGTAWVKRMEIDALTGLVSMPSGFAAASSSRIIGNSTGPSGSSYLGFVENNGITRTGYVGDVGNNYDISLASDNGNIALIPNLNTPGGSLHISPTSMTYSGGTLTMSNATFNLLAFSNGGLGIPTFNVRSPGSKINLWGSITSSQTGWDIGIKSNAIWFGVPTASSSAGWEFYGGITQVGRIDGKGSSEWNGQGRFKGWYEANGSGPAAEIGYEGGAAVFTGVNRSTSPAVYTTTQMIGGSTSTGNVFAIDGTGYRFVNLIGVKLLSTNSLGYLVDGSGGFIANSITGQSGNFNISGYGITGGMRINNSLMTGEPTPGLDLLFRTGLGTIKVSDGLNVFSELEIVSKAFLIKTAINGTPAERLRVTTNGDVGIGTTTPSQKLDVNGAAHASGVIMTDAGYKIKEGGTAATLGLASFAINVTSVVVNTTAVSANSRIFITVQSSGSPGHNSFPIIGARTPGSSFTISWLNKDVTTAATVAWQIVEPY